jgi:hypothetical protein
MEATEDCTLKLIIAVMAVFLRGECFVDAMYHMKNNLDFICWSSYLIII